MARVPYVDAKDLPSGYADVVPPDALNIRRAMANSPEAARLHGALAMFIRHKSRLDPRLREMAILQVGYSSRCVYEYAHHVELARQFGVSDDDIRAVADDTAGRPTRLDALTRAVLKAAREMTTGIAMSDETHAVLKQSLDSERLVELVLAISIYNSTVRVLESLKVDLEPGYERYLEAFPLPAR
ncbi:MAG TPA: carboxymuconolactone decarboxylase family protein [Stellaceae bacterium]|nr:carboxymuconolactone decarboxylase family protein [Stellaceae bacterium]